MSIGKQVYVDKEKKNEKPPKRLGNIHDEDVDSSTLSQETSSSTANQFEPSSSAVSCEEMLLAESSNQKAKETTAKKQRVKSVTASNKVPFSPQGSLDALLKLAQYPIKARAKVNAQQKNASKDVCTNKSVVLTNKNIDFEPDNLEQYPPFDYELSPQSGEVFAFMCLQIGPDYTPQMTRYVGELKQIEEGGEVLFLILYDENEGKDRSEKFELDSLVDGLLLKNREVNFQWSQLSDIRKIK